MSLNHFSAAKEKKKQFNDYHEPWQNQLYSTTSKLVTINYTHPSIFNSTHLEVESNIHFTTKQHFTIKHTIGHPPHDQYKGNQGNLLMKQKVEILYFRQQFKILERLNIQYFLSFFVTSLLRRIFWIFFRVMQLERFI